VVGGAAPCSHYICERYVRFPPGGSRRSPPTPWTVQVALDAGHLDPGPEVVTGMGADTLIPRSWGHEGSAGMPVTGRWRCGRHTTGASPAAWPCGWFTAQKAVHLCEGHSVKWGTATGKAAGGEKRNGRMSHGPEA
jgi:hypothetical protein